MNLNEFIKNIPLFSKLSGREIQYIIDHGDVKKAGKDETLHRPDEICQHVTVVLNGELHSTKYSISGKEQIVCSFKPGKCFGFPVVFGDLNYPEHIITDTECKLLYIHRDILMELFDNKAFLMQFMVLLSQKIKEFSDLVEVLSYTSVRERVAKYLVRQYEQQQTQILILGKNKTRLAKELGSVRVVVSRAFKAMEDQGIIEQLNENEIRIIDRDALEQFS